MDCSRDFDERNPRFGEWKRFRSGRVRLWIAGALFLVVSNQPIPRSWQASDLLRFSTSHRVQPQVYPEDQIGPAQDSGQAEDRVSARDPAAREGLDFTAPRPASHWATLLAEDARLLQAYGELFLDARDQGVFLAGHLAGARSLPASDPAVMRKVASLMRRTIDIYVPIAVYGKGHDSPQVAQLAESLYEAGFLNVLLCHSGYADLVADGLKSKQGPEPSATDPVEPSAGSGGVARQASSSRAKRYSLAEGGPAPDDGVAGRTSRARARARAKATR